LVRTVKRGEKGAVGGRPWDLWFVVCVKAWHACMAVCSVQRVVSLIAASIDEALKLSQVDIKAAGQVCTAMTRAWCGGFSSIILRSRAQM